MKFVIAFIFTVSSYIGLGQEIILTQEQLDSLSEPINKDISSNEIITLVEQVPIYKGCKKEKSNLEKKNCMSQKITEHVRENFNTQIHKESNIEPGKKRVSVIFKINTDGTIFDVRARAEDKYLEAEAIRVVKLIPKMTPGIKDGQPVVVPYSLPILVEVEQNKSLTKYPVYRGCDKTSSNKELEECSKRKIKTFIKMSYDIELASRAIPTEKSTQFLLEFTINKKGKIENVNAKANHKAVAIEAIRVAKRLPKFKPPGTIGGITVETPYKLLMTLYFN